VIGDEEAAQQTVVIKPLRDTAEQFAVPQQQLKERLRDMLNIAPAARQPE